MRTEAGLLTLQMIERRNDMQRLLGTAYMDQVGAARAVLVGVAAERKIPLAKAALQIAQELVAAGAPPDLMIAALVDEAEARGGTLR